MTFDWGPQGQEATIGWLRHSEIKHGRVAMAGFLGFIAHCTPIVSGEHKFLPYRGYVAGVTPQEQWDNIPLYGKLQILVLVGMLESYGEGASQPDGRSVGQHAVWNSIGPGRHAHFSAMTRPCRLGEREEPASPRRRAGAADRVDGRGSHGIAPDGVTRPLHARRQAGLLPADQGQGRPGRPLPPQPLGRARQRREAHRRRRSAASSRSSTPRRGAWASKTVAVGFSMPRRHRGLAPVGWVREGFSPTHPSMTTGRAEGSRPPARFN